MFLHYCFYIIYYTELTLCKTALLAVACQSHVCVDHVGGGMGQPVPPGTSPQGAGHFWSGAWSQSRKWILLLSFITDLGVCRKSSGADILCNMGQLLVSSHRCYPCSPLATKTMPCKPNTAQQFTQVSLIPIISGSIFMLLKLIVLSSS